MFKFIKNKVLALRFTTILRCLFFIQFGYVNAQTAYIVTRANEIKELDLVDLETTDLMTIDIATVGYIVDLAYAPNNKLYGITGNRQIIEIDIINNTFEFVYDIPLAENFPGMVANNNNELLFSSTATLNLHSYNITTNEFKIEATNVTTPGDFTFFKGNLIYPTNFDVKALNDIGISSVGCTEPLIFTFINVFEDCETNTIYGIDEQNIVYKYTIGTDEVEFHGTIAIPEIIFGGTTKTEYMASSCTLIALDNVDCSAILSVGEMLSEGIKVYPNPTIHQVFIDLPTFVTSASVKLIHMNGRLIQQWSDAPPFISFENESSGIYFLEITTAGHTILKQIIKR